MPFESLSQVGPYSLSHFLITSYQFLISWLIRKSTFFYSRIWKIPARYHLPTDMAISKMYTCLGFGHIFESLRRRNDRRFWPKMTKNGDFRFFGGGWVSMTSERLGDASQTVFWDARSNGVDRFSLRCVVFEISGPEAKIGDICSGPTFCSIGPETHCLEFSWA